MSLALCTPGSLPLSPAGSWLSVGAPRPPPHPSLLSLTLQSRYQSPQFWIPTWRDKVWLFQHGYTRASSHTSLVQGHFIHLAFYFIFLHLELPNTRLSLPEVWARLFYFIFQSLLSTFAQRDGAEVVILGEFWKVTLAEAEVVLLWDLSAKADLERSEKPIYNTCWKMCWKEHIITHLLHIHYPLLHTDGVGSTQTYISA